MPEGLQSLTVLKSQPPVVPAGLVRRRRLEDRLTEGTSKQFTLVCAGPGAGKTLTVAAWSTDGTPPGPVAWVSLDATDNDPQTFWSDLLGAVVSSGAVPPENGLRDIIPGPGFADQQAREVRVRLAELPGPVIVVLDDFHEITSDAVLEPFGQLVDHLPAPVRLVVLSRSDPPLRLHRLRVGGQLTEIRTGDLAFDEREAAALFDLHGMQLSSDQVNVLWMRTQGWSAGLQLAAMSLDPADIDDGIARFSGNDRSVADYLIGEVVDRLAPGDRDFLLRTSITERLTGDLADRLTGRTDSQLVLEKLAGANAFVMGLGVQQDWYSYHPLLRELLAHRLGLEHPRLVPELHRRAAEWMADNGEPIEAVRQSTLAGDLDTAGRRLLAVIPLILSVERPVLAAAIEPLALTSAQRPTLSSLLASAAVHYYRLDVGPMLQDAREAREFLDEAPEDVRTSAEAVILLFEMAAARSHGDQAGVLRLSNAVLELLDRSSRRSVPSGRHFRAVAAVNVGSAQIWADNFADSEQQLTASAPEALELGMALVNLNAIGHLALLDALQGRFRRAAHRAAESLRIIERRGWDSEPQALGTFLTMALVELSRCRPSAAAGYVGRGLASSTGQTDRPTRLALAIAAVGVAVMKGDANAALTADARLRSGLARTPDAAEMLVRWGAVVGADALILAGKPAEALHRIGEPGVGDGFAASWERVTSARAHLLLGQYAPIDALLEPLLVPGAAQREPAVQARLIQALVADHQHRDTAAMAAVGAAVELAQPEGIRRPFLALGGRLAPLLRRYRNLDGRHQEFVAGLVEDISPSSGAASDGSAVLVEHLTERELIVLHYLPTMLKAGEIAADLFVSVNTVKAHLRSIYRKLGVSNRREAVERARTIGLM